jgi:hypothetical protein
MTERTTDSLVTVLVPLHLPACLLKSCKHGFRLQGWLPVDDVVIAGCLGWMPLFGLAQKAQSESLFGSLDAKQFGFCDGFSHQLHLIKRY